VGPGRNPSVCPHGNNEEYDSQQQEYARRDRAQPTKKPLGQGRIHPSESLPRTRQKPLGEGRIHLGESLPRVRKRNLSLKEEFTHVNPCRESVKETSWPRKNSPK